jgi:hypothetical protein
MIGGDGMLLETINGIAQAALGQTGIDTNNEDKVIESFFEKFPLLSLPGGRILRSPLNLSKHFLIVRNIQWKWHELMEYSRFSSSYG